jgi:hypothetical protein
MSWFLLTQSAVPLGHPRDTSTDSAARNIEAMFCRLLGEEWETDLANRHASSPMSDAELDALFQELTNPVGPEDPLSPVGSIPEGAAVPAPSGYDPGQGQYQAWLGQWVGYVAGNGTVGLENIPKIIHDLCDRDIKGKHGKKHGCRFDCGSQYHACHDVFWVCTNSPVRTFYTFDLTLYIGLLPSYVSYPPPLRWAWYVGSHPAVVSQNDCQGGVFQPINL